MCHQSVYAVSVCIYVCAKERVSFMQNQGVFHKVPCIDRDQGNAPLWVHMTAVQLYTCSGIESFYISQA